MPADLTASDCATYPLHEIGAIQAHGYLLAIDRENHCVACSRNFIEDFGVASERVLQTPVRDLLESAALQVQGHVEHDDALEGRTRFVLQQDCIGYIGERHRASAHTLLEFRPASPEPGHGVEIDLISFITRLQGSDSETASAEVLLDLVARQTGFDRCMLYQFLPNGHGEVVAERRNSEVTSYLNHRFPAEDIPANARQLYVQNPVRLIPDVEGASIALIGIAGAPLPDLTGSRLRAVHPVHLSYLRNMQVVASFSLSLVVDGQLWGLIACHHNAPKLLSSDHLQRLEECLAITSLQVQGLRRSRIATVTEEAKRALSNLRSLVNVYSRTELTRAIAANLLPFLQSLAIDGCVIQSKRVNYVFGACPGESSLAQLTAWLDAQGEGDQLLTSLPEALRDNEELRRLACGCIRLDLAKESRVLLLRKEEREKVLWAGKPIDQMQDHLSPRASFASWMEETAFASRPWSPCELAGIEVIRSELDGWIHSRHFSELARSDALTGLPNRAGFEHFVEEVSAGAGRSLVLYFFDLDDFKIINDGHGHVIGDRLLCVIAQRLQHKLRKRELLARLGGDEFVLVQSGQIPHEAVLRTEMQIRHKVCAPVSLDTLSLQVGVSIGIARYPEDAPDLESLLRLADKKMYQNKQQRKQDRDPYS